MLGVHEKFCGSFCGYRESVQLPNASVMIGGNVALKGQHTYTHTHKHSGC